MPKQNRLSRADIVSLRPLRREHGRFFTATIAKKQGNKPKFAFVVSKKVATKANKRNLIKRRLRGALRELGLSAPYDIMFTAKRAAVDASYAELAADVQGVMNRLR